MYKTGPMKFSIHQHLVGLVLVAVIPVMLFASGLVIHLANQRSETLESNILSTTKALVSAVDENLIAVATSLRILSESEGFEADTVQFVHKRLRDFVKREKDWSHISFVDTRGVQIFNTAERFGKKLPRLSQDPSFKTMLETRKTVVSGFRPGTNVITISVPVIRNNVILYALVGSLKLESFSKLLKSQALPQNWTAAILDEKMNYIAHSRNPGTFTGKRASKIFIDKSRGKGAYGFSYVNNEGEETFGAIVNSKITNWKIMLRIPDDGHLFTSWKTLIYIVVGGTVLLILSVICALLVARRISRPLLLLRQSARDLGEGKSIQRIETSLSEVSEVNEALMTASKLRLANEEKMKFLYDKAQEAVKIRDTFMSVASHELKTPITTIKLQFQLLDRMLRKSESISHEALKRPISRVDNVVNRLNDLIDDLLDVSRISAGKLTYHPERIELAPFMKDIIHGLEEESERKGSSIFFSQESQLVCVWDRHRLEQVVTNLITNAIKYGEGNPIFIRISEENEKVMIEVKDHGMGITEENLPKIFDQFERVGNHNGISGLGLGLWIVKKILEGFHGSITAESKPGKGSTFRVYLPLGSVQHLSFDAHYDEPIVIPS